jgi:hypothetical protein
MEATKLVNRLLLDHGTEGNFAVGFDAFEDLDLLVKRFEEAGCAVELDRIKRILLVTLPPSAALY